jgi:hypothetical protein
LAAKNMDLPIIIAIWKNANSEIPVFIVKAFISRRIRRERRKLILDFCGQILTRKKSE